MLATNSGKHRWAYRKERDAWEVLLIASRVNQQIPIAASPRRVMFTRLYSGRKKLRDTGNVIGGMKLVVDAMVLAGLLVDDSPKFFEAYYRQVRIERGGGTVVLLEELAEEVAEVRL